MDRSAAHRVIGATNYWLFKRQNLASQMGQKKAFLFYRRSARFHRAFFNAAINDALDGSRFIVGTRCFY